MKRRFTDPLQVGDRVGVDSSRYTFWEGTVIKVNRKSFLVEFDDGMKRRFPKEKVWLRFARSL